VFNYNPWSVIDASLAQVRDAFAICEMHSRPDLQAAKRQGEKLSWRRLGTTEEGRELMVLSWKGMKEAARKPVIWMDCGMHARDWSSVAACIFVAYKLSKTPEGAEVLRVKTFNIHR